MKKTISIVPNEVTTAKLHGYLLGAVGPRPIAFASTVDKDGNPNLSPFSFFNVFSANPPILIFSPARRVRNNTTKHTLENVLETKEVVINIVNYSIVQQMSLSSTEYAEGINEFDKAGLTMLKSDLVKPFRVAESPVQFECKVTKVEALGEEGGAGNLIFAEVVKVHVDTTVLDENGSIDQHKIDLVARMGGNWYSRAKEGMFEVPKPLSTLGIGVDSLPLKIRNSKLLSGNDLGLLGNIEQLPSAESVTQFVEENVSIRSVLSTNDGVQLQLKAKEYIFNEDVTSALKLLIAGIDLIE
ncbi:flavin reductase family protein [Cellulophaga fucicola]|uniref:NADH-FMN oxidoreductase RutF, flavin reductase (DIM6/NTAB) family n=1 Tax=Cellulophaga fucicola TaxID=76595 RepID=A0A1K1QP95_9FLAO|nr:flavin reductase family protein [Cellulophaga fucicola]SFW61720.1 NADH-FMN oxidoreductase RutF, flavin reductase (DIM6/NTAB) family [Cellulophaga fucicola]